MFDHSLFQRPLTLFAAKSRGGRYLQKQSRDENGAKQKIFQNRASFDQITVSVYRAEQA
tara:strand:- start:94 stop:270 length:177 start_codon:yes stop_codon:yes gene_type:complete